MTTRVVIVRHGQSSYNALKMIQGRCDESVLTEKGRADALKVGQALSKLNFDAFYCSPLQRAKQTAETIQNCLENSPTLEAHNLLMEIDLPLWEKLKKEDVQTKFAEDYRCWKDTPHEFKMLVATTAGDKAHFPVLALYQQAQQFWKEIIAKHEGRTILIVAHNGINRCLIMSALGIPPERYHSIQQTNCNINVLNFSGELGESVQLESLNQTTHLGIPLPPPRSEQNLVRVLLVRHGETEWNRVSRFQGSRDVPLNENGKEQGRKAAEFLQDTELTFAVSSPMLRPKETAELILANHPEIFLELQHDLCEIGHGLWEGKLEPEIEQEFPDLLRQWREEPETVQMPEGENLQQVWDRAIACWNDIIQVQSEEATKQPQTGIIVAHDAINKVILCYLLGLQPKNFWNIKQGNGAVSVIDYPKGAVGYPVLQAINLTTHLSDGVIDQTAAGAL